MYDIRQQQDFAVDRYSEPESQTPFEDRQLLVVSNRQPYRHQQSQDGDVLVDSPAGGLTAALDPMMQRLGDTWIAWGDGDGDRAHVDANQQVAVPPEDPAYTLRRVWLSEEQVDGYYYGFSNQVLWPLCHSSLATVRSKESYWQQYKQTNEQFAEVVSEAADERPIIWLHDYHFGLAASEIRDRMGGAPILMQFWHIPWPSREVFRACPHGRELIEGLLANDIIGFHVGRYCHNFLECVDNEFPNASINWRTGTISYRGQATRVRSIPIGVPFEEIQRDAESYGSEEFVALKRSYDIDPETKIAVGVDRLDYSKGIAERLQALERFWEENPEWRGSVTHLLNCSESRSAIPAYQQVQDRVDESITRINERFGTEDWQPIVEVTEYLTQRELSGLYRHSDLCLVTPICDGLNLVAMEYVAAQVDDAGALVLSDQAGIHDLLGESAVSVSPYDPGQIADRIDHALRMARPARQSRMETLRERASDNDLQTWLSKHGMVARMALANREVSSTSA